MTQEMNTARDLASMLAERQDEIVATWVEMANQLRGARYPELPPEDLKTTS